MNLPARLITAILTLALATLHLPAARAAEPTSQPAQSQLPAALPRKPPPGSQINWQHPLSVGLVSAVPLNEGTGNAFYDAAAKETYTAQTLPHTSKNAQPPVWIIPPITPDYPWGGPALSNNNAAAQSICANLKPNRQFIEHPATGYSYAVLLQPLDDKTFGRIMDGTGAAVITIYLNIPKDREGQLSTTWRTADNHALNPTAKFKPNQWLLVLFTVQPGLGIMYINGQEVARDTHVNLAQSCARQTGQLAYNSTGQGGMMPNANFSSFWIWNNHALTPQEAAQFAANPWAMFTPATNPAEK